MIDCFGGTDYGFRCDICYVPTSSCKDPFYIKGLCDVCLKAVEDAKEQRRYLQNLKTK